jgi:hypothetical protein
MRNLCKLSHQAVGAFGESAVEAELLRHGWIPANVNATIKNAADFDIYALKNGHTVHLRVRACGPDTRAFQFGGFDPAEQVKVGKFNDTDFTVLVSMSSDRNRDQFYVLPQSGAARNCAKAKGISQRSQARWDSKKRYRALDIATRKAKRRPPKSWARP